MLSIDYGAVKGCGRKNVSGYQTGFLLHCSGNNHPIKLGTYFIQKTVIHTFVLYTELFLFNILSLIREGFNKK